MKRLLLASALALVVGCAMPQYTVVPPQGQTTTTTTEAVNWPDISKWDEGSSGTSDIGIIVAIEDYAFLPDVPGAVQNANDWESYLKTARGAERVYTITNKQATSEEIRRFVKQAASEAGPDSTVWFVYIGHGAPALDGKDGAMVAMDAQQTVNSLQTRSIKRGEVLALLEAGQQKQTVLVLDTCFSGKDPSGNLLAKGSQPVIPVDQATPDVAGRTVVLTAAASNEFAGQLPGAERPAFSYLLLGAMRGWADTGNGEVAALEARDYVAKQFRHLKGRQQTPSIFGISDVVLASTVKEADPGVAEYIKGDGTRKVVTTVPANPTGAKVIDTNVGFVFEQPDGWAIGYAGGPVVLTMQSMYGGSMITVERFETSASNAAAIFANRHDPSMLMEGTRPSQKAVEKVYGSIRGAESRTRTVDPDFGNSETIVFETYQAGAAYWFKLIIKDQSRMAVDHATFQKFIAGAKFGSAQSSSVPNAAPKSNESAELQFKMFKFLVEQATR